MKKCILIHPRRLTKVMREYLQQVVDESDICHSINVPAGNYSFDYLWEHLDDDTIEWDEIIVTPTVRLTHKKGFYNFCVYTSEYCDDEENDILHFEYDAGALLKNGSRNYYRGLGFVLADMGRRASYMKGFAQVTRILLHEIGHVASYDNVHAKYTDEELSTLHQQTKGNRKYIQLPDEFAATQWAIDWLADEQHRKAAKEFEKKFWPCFA